MASAVMPGFSGIRYLKIFNEPQHFLSKDDVGGEFVRTQPLNGEYDHIVKYKRNYQPNDPIEEKIRKCALKLVVFKENGSMIFEKACSADRLAHFEWRPSELNQISTIELSSEWNDGNWISIEECIQLWKSESPNVTAVGSEVYDGYRPS